MPPEITDHTRTTLEDIPDNLGLDDFDAEPHGQASRRRAREHVADPATNGSPTYRVLSPSDPIATATSIETRRPVRLTLGQRALDRVLSVALVAIEKGLALVDSRRQIPIRIDQSAAVAIALAVAVVGYGALYLLVWDRPAPAQSRIASRIVRTTDAAPVVAPRPAAPVETAARTVIPASAPTPTHPLKPAPAPTPAAAKPAVALEPATMAAARPATATDRTFARQPAPALPASNVGISQPLPAATVEVAVSAPPPVESRPAEVEVAAVRLPVAAAATVSPSRARVDEVLAAYRHSYNTLDAKSVLRVWDGADERALQRAFSSLKQQRVAFDSCDVDITSADRALAHCVGVLSYVPKYGSASEQRRAMEWTIYLQRHDRGWVIAYVAAREDGQGPRE